MSNFPSGFNASHFGEPDANGIRPFNDIGHQFAMSQIQPTQSLLGNPSASQSQQIGQPTSSLGKGLIGEAGNWVSGGMGTGMPSATQGLIGGALKLLAL